MRRAALVALGLVTAACSSSPPTETATPVTARAGAWRVREPGGMAPIDPGAASADLLDADGCATCHAAIAAEWRASRHALAWTNGLFQREYQQHPEPWCVNCHAPLTTQQRELAREGAMHPHADRGVDCATCHVRGGQLVSRTRGAHSPHATVVDASFGSPAYCADCHQFTFPRLDDAGHALAMTGEPMQTTVASFSAGPFAAKGDGCMQCHGSRANHAFAGGHDPGMLGAALEVAWCRDDARLRLTITNAAAGHSVPTGDIHRHMSLRAWRSSAPAALFDVFLGRRFEPAADGTKTTTWDSTIPPAESRRFAVDAAALGGDADEPINLELVYVFLADEHPRGLVGDAPSASLFRRRAAWAELPACAP